MPKRTRAQRIADSKAMGTKWTRAMPDPLAHSQRKRDAWAVVRSDRDFHPHTRATPREYVKGLR